MEQKLINILNKYKLIAKHKVALQSFSEKSLKKLHSSIKIFFLSVLGDEEVKGLNNTLYAYAIGPNAKLADDEIVKKAHAENLQIHVFLTEKMRKN
ncbi:hypothetical protein [Bacillus atrophaeus]|uniref:hypothetical protein n=1 Tax=Bacillus atrophaeus TaxID=1452 RepID=UPI002281DB05|nr:hypothetical protein [Bacillus atrophaeus]MCY8512227.1 hypothetical protein [Bacillus atrophaeus]MCY8993086.1 hypothetical protein [Bacillus atrophaeus]